MKKKLKIFSAVVVFILAFHTFVFAEVPSNVIETSIVSESENNNENFIFTENEDMETSVEEKQNADTEKPVDTEQNTDNEKSADTEQNADTEKPVDTEQNTDNEKSADTEQNADTEKPVDTEQNTDTEKPVDTEQNTDNQKPADIEQNAVTQEPIEELANEDSIILGHDGITIEDNSTSASDIKYYKVTVNFDETPDVMAVLVRTGSRGITCRADDSTGQFLVGGTVTAVDAKSVITSKKFMTLTNPNPDSSTYTYTFKVWGYSGSGTDGSFRFMIGESKDIETMLGGIENTVNVSKYVGTYTTYTNYVRSGYIPKEAKEYYKYVADTDDKTFVSISSSTTDKLRFTVVDPITGKALYEATSSDVVVDQLGSSARTYMIGTKLDLIAGREYDIIVESDGYHTSKVDLQNSYTLYVGKPQLVGNKMLSYQTSTSTVTATPSKSGSCLITISGLPKSAKASNVKIDIGNPNNLGAWELVSPNGVKFKDSYGYSSKTLPLDQVDFNNPNNAVVNGTWKFTFKSDGKSVTVKPGLLFSYYYEAGDKE